MIYANKLGAINQQQAENSQRKRNSMSQVITPRNGMSGISMGVKTLGLETAGKSNAPSGIPKG